ncbi:GCN5-related N-acetyltransferase [Hyaloscypha sp. PMI_1271]|nr:GCN5-related N-acetyltransferase [Hyaloscypha sp. PMI_1271]
MDKIPPLQGATFLPPESSLSQRWVALCLQVQAWYLHCSRASENPSIFRIGDILCTTSHFTLPSEESVEDDQVLESIIDWYRVHRQNGAIIWYLHPKAPVHLDARFYARGVCPNWEPHWMWCDLREMMQAGKPRDRFKIRVKAESESTSVPDAGSNLVWDMSAMRENEWLGGCTLNVKTGEYGVGGLFDMYVKPEERKQGIGGALTQAACEFAMKLGCHHMVVNATDDGAPIYQRVGFRSMGMGRTWFLRDSVLALPPPSNGQVKFLEAVGRGDMNALDMMKDDILPEQLSLETINGETPFEIAVRCKQTASSEWLIDHGVVPDIMSLWDLGWKDRIPALLATSPELVRRKAGRWTATPLHYAIELNDADMAKLLLSVPNDLESRDGVFRSTPMEWAQRFQRTEIIEFLESVREMST